MGEREIVSVVIPAYNAERFIKDAVISCFRQTYRPLEIVVVNDGSTDSTVDVINDTSKSVSGGGLELKLMDIGENKGAANALNVGFSKATGSYICWLSADDVFTDRKKIETQVAHVAKTEALWSYFRDFYSGSSFSEARMVRSSFLPRLRFLDSLFIQSPDLRLMLLLFKNPLNGSSAMIRKKCVETYGQFDPITRNVDGDGDLWMRYSALGLKLSALKGAPVFYRQHTTQTSKGRSRMMYGSELTRMRILLALEKEGNLTRLIKKFTPFFPIVIGARKHFERPFVSEFLFGYILGHPGDFDRVFLKYIRLCLSSLKSHPNYLSIDKDRFLIDLDSFVNSHTFKMFKELYEGQQWRKRS